MNKRIKTNPNHQRRMHKVLVILVFLQLLILIISHVLEILKIYLALLLCKCEGCGGLLNFSFLVLEKDKIAKQSTTCHKHVTVTVRVVLAVEANLFHISSNFLTEDEYILYYIKIVCGMCGMLLWCV